LLYTSKIRNNLVIVNSSWKDTYLIAWRINDVTPVTDTLSVHNSVGRLSHAISPATAKLHSRDYLVATILICYFTSQSYQLSTVNAHTDVLQPIHRNISRHYSRYCAVVFRYWFTIMLVAPYCCRNALNIVKDDLISQLDELSGWDFCVLFHLFLFYNHVIDNVH